MLNCTLYISGLPRRPTNKEHYIYFLLQQFNPQNRHITNFNSELFNDKQLLDSQWRIISIARSNKNHLKGKVFITFQDTKAAQKFNEQFNHFKINGKKIRIEKARKDSFVSISLTEPKKLGKILQVKHLSQRKSEVNLKRKLRRLRSKLSTKGKFTSDEINAMVQDYKNKLLKIDELKDKKEVLKTTHGKTELEAPLFETKETNEIKKKSEKKTGTTIVNVQENKPNKILLVQNLPKGADSSQVQTIFNGPGFQECRLVSIRNLAFIEFNSIENATLMLNKLGHYYKFNEEGHKIAIGFAK